MKTSITNSRVEIIERVLMTAAALACAVVFTWPSPAHAGKGNQNNPAVIPPQAVPDDHTYGEWSALWWQWAFGQAPDVNPVLDTTGDLAGAGQSGPVWFLAGTFGGPAERQATIPAGKKLFFPIVNWSVWEPDDDETSRLIVEHLGLDLTVLTEAEILRLTANWLADRSMPVSCSVDGLVIRNLEAYRAESPDFEFIFDNELAGLFDLPGGLKSPAVADGYWLMLAPLSVGEHTIEFHGVADISTANGDPFDLYFTVDIIYHLTVVAE